jgi:hypothetical protein
MDQRARELVEAEADQPERWCWLSFCDPAKPRGSQFLGACLVRARGTATAVRRAWELKINPGGEVRVQIAPEHFVVHDGWADRLLTREQCAEFDRIHRAQA